MMPDAIIAHESSGRLRIKIPASRGDAGVLAKYRDHLSHCPGIVSVEINPITGSILLLHQTSVAAIFDYAQEKGVFTQKVVSPATRKKSPALQKDMAETFKGFDRQIRSLTDGDMDLRGMAFAALAISGISQILRGNAGALPWHAAFWYAFNILPKTSEGADKQNNE
jgi:Heavy metal associated domain 2